MKNQYSCEIINSGLFSDVFTNTIDEIKPLTAVEDISDLKSPIVLVRKVHFESEFPDIELEK